MELDIYIPSIKTAIEYDGAAWHKGEKSNRRELAKYKKCKNEGITLIRIKEHLDYFEEAVSDVTIKTSASLEETLRELGLYISLPADIDTTRDAKKIKAQYYGINNFAETTEHFILYFVKDI